MRIEHQEIAALGARPKARGGAHDIDAAAAGLGFRAPRSCHRARRAPCRSPRAGRHAADPICRRHCKWTSWPTPRARTAGLPPGANKQQTLSVPPWRRISASRIVPLARGAAAHVVPRRFHQHQSGSTRCCQALRATACSGGPGSPHQLRVHVPEQRSSDALRPSWPVPASPSATTTTEGPICGTSA